MFHKTTGIGLALVLLITFSCSKSRAHRAKVDWRSDWSVKEPFSLTIDSTGYAFPTAIAFIPNPGIHPKDPLYFVAELRGKIKVVTNDRTVHTFAENFVHLNPVKEVPDGEGEIGAGGLCLDPVHGYVFVTFADQDSNMVFKNNIVRFTSIPNTFSLKPSGQITFDQVFKDQPSGVSHQIGNCQVVDDSLYVGLGEAHRPYASQQLDSVLGKVLRMTLDGKPDKDNPFYAEDGGEMPANYIYARGFRNPFAIRSVGQRIFVADNGGFIDRFVEIDKGSNYLWDGNDLSIGTNAKAVFSPSVGPTQMEYYPKDLQVFPEEYRERFYLAVSGLPAAAGPAPGKGVMTFRYDFQNNRMMDVPEYLVQYRGKGYQAVVGLGLAKDGLYFVPMFANQKGKTSILKLRYTPNKPHPFNLQDDMPPEALMWQKGCYGCHQASGEDGEAPGLKKELLLKRIPARLQSQDYLNLLKKLDQMDKPYYPDYANARKEIPRQKGTTAIRTWVMNHLLEPRFDNPNSRMPNLGLSHIQARRLTTFLIGVEQTRTERWANRATSLFQKQYILPLLVGIMIVVLPLVLIRFFKGSAKTGQ